MAELPPGVSMVNVGGMLYRSDQKFNWESSDTGSRGTTDAAGAAQFLQRNPKMRRIREGVWDYGGNVGAAHLAADTSQKYEE